MSYPVTTGYDHVEIQQPSMFLDEIPEQMYETIKLTHARNSFQRKPMYNRYVAHEEPTIVLDDMGETISRPAPSSFLRGIDEL